MKRIGADRLHVGPVDDEGKRDPAITRLSGLTACTAAASFVHQAAVEHRRERVLAGRALPLGHEEEARVRPRSRSPTPALGEARRSARCTAAAAAVSRTAASSTGSGLLVPARPPAGRSAHAGASLMLMKGRRPFATHVEHGRVGLRPSRTRGRRDWRRRTRRASGAAGSDLVPPDVEPDPGCARVAHALGDDARGGRVPIQERVLDRGRDAAVPARRREALRAPRAAESPRETRRGASGPKCF